MNVDTNVEAYSHALDDVVTLLDEIDRLRTLVVKHNLRGGGSGG